MTKNQSAFIDDLSDALAEAKTQLKSTAKLLKARGESSTANELTDIEQTLVNAEITISKKFPAISEIVSGPAEKTS
ncbi:MAG: hypothetical protein HYX29_05140 [Solirubrobacterales bacterium]|nr:hypothetical protein [Solirubrobacterales bacterium]